MGSEVSSEYNTETFNSEQSSPRRKSKHGKHVTQREVERYFGNRYAVVVSRQIFDIRSEIVQIRRYFHQNPELSFQEVNTASNIGQYLHALKLATTIGMGNTETAVVAVLKGAFDGPCIMLRASMDALPIQELDLETNQKYRSIHKGVMHANGNDGQMAILCATAKVLSELKQILHGSVKFVFQPCKETSRGAKLLLEDRILENPRVDQVYSCVLASDLLCGQARCINNGGLPYIAGNLTFEILVHGKGGHGAFPHTTKDSVVAVSHLAQQLYSIVSRNVDPLKACALSISSIYTDGRTNVIAGEAKLNACIRWFQNEQLQIVLQRVRQICEGIEKSFEVKIDFNILTQSEPITNKHEECIQLVRKTIQQILPDSKNNEAFTDESYATTSFDDFGVFTKERPGCMFMLGCAPGDPQGKPRSTANTKQFQMDEKCLTIGAQIMTTLVLERLVNWEKIQT